MDTELWEPWLVSSPEEDWLREVDAEILLWVDEVELGR